MRNKLPPQLNDGSPVAYTVEGFPDVLTTGRRAAKSLSTPGRKLSKTLRRWQTAKIARMMEGKGGLYVMLSAWGDERFCGSLMMVGLDTVCCRSRGPRKETPVNLLSHS